MAGAVIRWAKSSFFIVFGVGVCFFGIRVGIHVVSDQIQREYAASAERTHRPMVKGVLGKIPQEIESAERAVSVVSQESTDSAIRTSDRVFFLESAASPACDSIALSWTPALDAEQYIIYRSDGARDGFRTIAYVPALQYCGTFGCSYTDTGLERNRQYQYFLRSVAVGGRMENNQTRECTGSTGICPLTVETQGCVLSGLRIVSPNAGVLLLEWDPIADAAQYAIYRSIGSADVFTPIATVATTEYRDEAILLNQQYAYYVVPLSRNGQAGAASRIVEGMSVATEMSEL